MAGNRFFRISATLATIVLGAFLALSIGVVISGMRDDIHRADFAVVLGNEVNADGRPSRRLAARLNTAAALYHRGLFANIVVSGATGRAGFDEAVVMKKYLVKLGLPQHKIIADGLGVTTAATARNAAAIAKEHHWSSVFVISQYFHIPRCRLALSRAGFDHIYSGHAQYVELRDIYSIPREVVGYAAYLSGLRN